MIRFGIVGTSWITEEFIRCASLIKDFKLNAIYSRSEDKAKAFGNKYCVDNIYTDINSMAESNLIDAVYIASPNSFHAEQSILFMKNKKHVLCEKPIASNLNELKKMISASKENNVLLMEAIKLTFLPTFKSIKDNLYKIGDVKRYFGNYCQYSSRYDLYKNGKNPNTFNPIFSNGSLMDLGIYCVYPLIYLFGMPKSFKSNGYLLPSGVDGEGSILLKYDTMDGVIMHSKITNSMIGSEIQGENGSILIDKISCPEKVKILYKSGEIEDISVPQLKENMYYETYEFIELIKANKLESNINSHKLSSNVMEIMDSVRKEIGLQYPADIII